LYNAGIKDIFILTRFPVTLAVTFTSLAAMVIEAGQFHHDMWWPVFGIFLLASGASAFNQYQEWPYDEKMDRTRRRPIPSRRISPAEGVRIALIGIAGGLIILMYESTWITFLLGVFNLIWYNGLYTFLKRKTVFAVVPGALTGAIPVLMGWSALGGSLLSPTALFLAAFVFIWQMPHFWMMMLKYGSEYQNAGFRALPDLFSDRQIKTIVMAWIIASAAVSLMFIHFSLIRQDILVQVMIIVSLLLILLIFWQLFLAGKRRDKLIFMTANLYILIVLIIVMADKLTGL
jgi:protoheme IX farnesyltransferase